MYSPKFKITEGGNLFQNLEKTTVLQEARIFNETTVNPRKCTPILTKLLYLINQVSRCYSDSSFSIIKLVLG